MLMSSDGEINAVPKGTAELGGAGAETVGQKVCTAEHAGEAHVNISLALISPPER